MTKKQTISDKKQRASAGARFLLLALLLPMLTGCEEKRSYSYYMQHPQVLQDVVEKCHHGQQNSQDQAAMCEIAFYAASNLMALLNEQQADPEGFGQRILDAENAYTGLSASVKRAQQSLEETKGKNAPMAEIRAAQDDLYKAQQACDKQLQELKELLAVVGMSSPD